MSASVGRDDGEYVEHPVEPLGDRYRDADERDRGLRRKGDNCVLEQPLLLREEFRNKIGDRCIGNHLMNAVHGTEHIVVEKAIVRFEDWNTLEIGDDEGFPLCVCGKEEGTTRVRPSFSMRAEDLIEHVCSMIPLIQQAGVTLNLKRGVSFSGHIAYLSHIIHPGKLEVPEHSQKATEGLEQLRTVTALWSFLRLCNFFRSSVPNFARLPVPLNRKLRKDEPMTSETWMRANWTRLPVSRSHAR